MGCCCCLLLLWIGVWHLPSASTEIESWVTAAADPQHPWKELRVESRSEDLLALGKLEEQVFRQVFWEKILWAQFLHLLISRKEPSWWSLLLSFPAATFCKNVCLVGMYTEIPNTLTSPCLFGELFPIYLKCCLLGRSPHFAPNKT